MACLDIVRLSDILQIVTVLLVSRHRGRSVAELAKNSQGQVVTSSRRSFFGAQRLVTPWEAS
jgi:hypothetical protein